MATPQFGLPYIVFIMITASVGLTSSYSIHRKVYPILMVFILWESIWNDDSDSYSRGRGIGVGIDTGEHNDKHERALTRKSADIQVLSLGGRMHFAMRTETDTKMESGTFMSIGDVCSAGASVQRSVAVRFLAEGSNSGSAEKDNYRCPLKLQRGNVSIDCRRPGRLRWSN